MSGYDPIARLRDVVDKEIGLQPADTTAEQLVSLVERELFERRKKLGEWRRWIATHPTAPCFGCGKRDFEPAVDNHGVVYLGCTHCRIVL